MAEANASRPAAKPRPISPHLQVYTLTISMLMSIVHRITGAALYFGTLILAWWLIAAATSPSYFSFVSDLLGTIPGKIVLIGYTWALVHHALGGLKHLIWDTGRGFNLYSVNALSWASIILSIVITGGIWACFLLDRGLLQRIGL